MQSTITAPLPEESFPCTPPLALWGGFVKHREYQQPQGLGQGAPLPRAGKALMWADEQGEGLCRLPGLWLRELGVPLKACLGSLQKTN